MKSNSWATVSVYFFVSFFWKQTALSALLDEACKISLVLRAVSIQLKRPEMKQLVKIDILYNMKKLFFYIRWAMCRWVGKCKSQSRVVWISPCLCGVFGNRVWWGECFCSLVKCSTYTNSPVRTQQTNTKRTLIHCSLLWAYFNHASLTEQRLSPVLSKCPIILLHRLDLWVLVSVFFFFHCQFQQQLI